MKKVKEVLGKIGKAMISKRALSILNVILGIFGIFYIVEGVGFGHETNTAVVGFWVLVNVLNNYMNGMSSNRSEEMIDRLFSILDKVIKQRDELMNKNKHYGEIKLSAKSAEALRKKTNQNSEQYISIPFSIMMDDRLSQTQKMIFGFVNGFDVGNNICYASNAYIGSIIGINDTNSSRAISKLIELKLIYASNGKGRLRTLTTDINEPVTINLKK